MRKKLAIAVALVLLVLLVTVSVAWWMPQAEPPLRVGMPREEVIALLGEPENGWYSEHTTDSQEFYYHQPDWLGNHHVIVVNFSNSHVTIWGMEPLPRTRPPWLDRAMKSAGW